MKKNRLVGTFAQVAIVAAVALIPKPAMSSGGTCPDDFVNWADRLGYGEDAKVLIIHADDAGSFVGANEAVEQMFNDKTIDSASVMVPAPFYGDLVERYNANQHFDVGLHITLNSRENYAWRPVYEPTKGVKRILKHRFLWWGWRPYFPSEWFYSWLYRGPKTVEKEIEAQIERAVSDMTVPPTHFDSHVGSVFAHKSHFKKYLFAGLDHGVAAMTFENWPRTTTCMSGLDDDDPVVRLSKMLTDRLKKAQRKIPDWPFPRIDVYCVVPYAAGTDLDATQTNLAVMITNLPKGITQILIHPSNEDVLVRELFPQHLADRRILIDRHLLDPGNVDLDAVMGTLERTNWREMTERFELSKDGTLCSNPTGLVPFEAPSCCP